MAVVLRTISTFATACIALNSLLLTSTPDYAECRPTSPNSWQAWWPWLGLGYNHNPNSIVASSSKQGTTDTANEVAEDGFTLASCAVCELALKMVKAALDYGKPREHLQKMLELACTVSGELTPAQCYLILEKYTERIAYVMSAKDESISFGDICASLTGIPCTVMNGGRLSWEVQGADFDNGSSALDEDAEEEFLNEDEFFSPESRNEATVLNEGLSMSELRTADGEENYREPRSKRILGETRDENSNPSDEEKFARRHRSSKRQTFKILHIADIHHDPLYAEGSNANCGSYLCCHRSDSSSGSPMKETDRAGKWGDYRNCDSPTVLVEFMLDHMKRAHKGVEMVYWTGDVNPHDPWDLDNFKAAWNLNYTLNQLKSRFEHVPIFSAVGNHETDPTNLFPSPKLAAFKPPFDSTKWLYDSLKREWPPMTLSSYTDLKESVKTIQRAGFYSASPMPGFRVISVNTMFCYNFNIFNYLSYPDPGHQLEWLNRELLAAERSSEKVHIIGHVPPGYPDCLPSWSHSFRNICCL